MFEGQWYWCSVCETPAISCNHCNNSSCNAGGCEKCHDAFNVIMKMSREERPKKEDIPHTKEQLQKFWDDKARSQGWTENQIEDRRKEWDKQEKAWELIAKRPSCDS